MPNQDKIAASATDRDERSARASFTFRRIASKTQGELLRFRECELSRAQLRALSQIETCPGLTVHKLAASLSVHQSTASNLIEKLESAGLVRKKREDLDRRVVRIYPTASGAEALRKAPTPGSGILLEALNGLSDEELVAVEGALRLLAEKITSE